MKSSDDKLTTDNESNILMIITMTYKSKRYLTKSLSQQQSLNNSYKENEDNNKQNSN